LVHYLRKVLSGSDQRGTILAKGSTFTPRIRTYALHAALNTAT